MDINLKDIVNTLAWKKMDPSARNLLKKCVEIARFMNIVMVDVLLTRIQGTKILMPKTITVIVIYNSS